MKIGLDTTFLFDQYAYRGIGNYGREVIKRLIKNKEHDWILFGYGSKNSNLNELGIKLASNIRFVSLGNRRKSNILNILFFKFVFLPKIKKERLDLFFSCNFEQGIPLGITKTVVVLHDVIPYLTKSYSQKGRIVNAIKGFFYRHNLNRARRADVIVSNSNYTKSELANKAGFNSDKIVKIYPGIKDHFKLENIDPEKRDIRRILITYNITPPYILYYGGIEDNKNVPSVIQSFFEVSNRFPDLKLVIVGKEFKLGWDNKVKPLSIPAANLLKLCSDLRIKHKVIFTGEAQENHMPIILSNARLMLHLSNYEGFGLAALEALAAGVPLIASNKSSYPEVLGEAATLVDPQNPKRIGEVIEQILSDTKLYTSLKNKGLKHTKAFNWESTSDELLKVFKFDIKDKVNKRFVFVTPYFYPFSGGAENNCLAIAKGVKKYGADVKVLTSYRSDFKCKKTEIYDGIAIHRFSRWNNAYYAGFYPGLLFKLLSTRADVIHVHGFGFIWQDFCLFVKRIFSPRTKFINTPHGPFMALDSYSGPAKLLKAFYTPILKLFLKYTYDKVIQVNPSQVEWIKKYGIKENKIIYVPNGINAEIFNPGSSIQLTENRYKLNNKFVISFIGRFEEYKGVQDIVKALAELKQIKDIKFVAIGVKGSYLDSLISLIKDNDLDDKVEILLNPSDEVKLDILSLSKTYLLPSRWEAFGISILEAMAQGNAIITTNTEGGRFLIEENTNGFLVKFGDYKLIAEKIKALYDSHEQLELMQQNNIEKAKLFVWDSIIKEYVTKLL